MFSVPAFWSFRNAGYWMHVFSWLVPGILKMRKGDLMLASVAFPLSKHNLLIACLLLPGPPLDFRKPESRILCWLRWLFTCQKAMNCGHVFSWLGGPGISKMRKVEFMLASLAFRLPKYNPIDTCLLLARPWIFQFWQGVFMFSVLFSVEQELNIGMLALKKVFGVKHVFFFPPVSKDLSKWLYVSFGAFGKSTRPTFHVQRAAHPDDVCTIGIRG
jgi:hypothetical protein